MLKGKDCLVIIAFAMLGCWILYNALSPRAGEFILPVVTVRTEQPEGPLRFVYFDGKSNRLITVSDEVAQCWTNNQQLLGRTLVKVTMYTNKPLLFDSGCLYQFESWTIVAPKSIVDGVPAPEPYVLTNIQVAEKLQSTSVATST